MASRSVNVPNKPRNVLKYQSNYITFILLRISVSDVGTWSLNLLNLFYKSDSFISWTFSFPYHLKVISRVFSSHCSHFRISTQSPTQTHEDPQYIFCETRFGRRIGNIAKRIKSCCHIFNLDISQGFLVSLIKWIKTAWAENPDNALIQLQVDGQGQAGNELELKY